MYPTIAPLDKMHALLHSDIEELAHMQDIV